MHASVFLFLLPIEFSYIHIVRVYFCGSSLSALNAAAARTMYEHIVLDVETV